MFTNADRERVFGKFSYVAAPRPHNAERIDIDPTWLKANLVSVRVAALKGVRGVPAQVYFHRLVAPRFIELLSAWEKEGLLGDILSWNGSFASRFRRGQASTQNLSSHAWGTSFDINAAWNAFRARPAAPGAKGSVHALVRVAKQLGWLWGGDFSTPDGMHIEAGEIEELEDGP